MRPAGHPDTPGIGRQLRAAYPCSWRNGGLPAAATATAATATPIIVRAEGSLPDAGGNNDFDTAGSPQPNGKHYPKTDVVFVDLDCDGVRKTAHTTGGKDDFQ